MVSRPGSTPLEIPAVNEDGSLRGVVVRAQDLPADRLHLRLPGGTVPPDDAVAGRYLLARCAEGDRRRQEWSIYLRRPLFVCEHRRFGDEEDWIFALPARTDDPGYRWLARQPDGTPINLLGPFGNGFAIQPNSRNLLLLADAVDDPRWVQWLLPLVDPVLDRGGQVTLLVRTDGPLAPALRDALPLALEVRVAVTEAEWHASLGETLRWADQVCAGIAARDHAALLHAMHNHRFFVGEGFAQVLVKADLLCGVGACLACVIPLPGGGVTRACVHGPVFDLLQLAE